MSAKRTALLKETIQQLMPDIKSITLKSLCETRWIQRHDSVILFKDCLKPILVVLDTLEQTSADGSVKAHTLLNSVSQFTFLVTTSTLSKMLSLTHNLSEFLQSKDIDLTEALQRISDILEMLRSMRNEPQNISGTFI